MKTRIIEAVVGQILWTPFLVGQFDHEREHVSPVEGRPLLRRECPTDIVLFDLGTKEGAVFAAQGHARTDMKHHCIWTSPLFEGFLTWVRSQLAQGVELADLPARPRGRTGGPASSGGVARPRGQRQPAPGRANASTAPESIGKHRQGGANYGL